MLMISSGDFSLYDHVLDHSAAFNVIPKRYRHLGLSNLDVYFAMGRGHQSPGVNVPACEMKKWYVFSPAVYKIKIGAMNAGLTPITITSYPNFQRIPISN